MLELPLNTTKILVHSCCAPCSGSIIEQLNKENISCTILYYNPNIHPEAEYLKRKEEQKVLATKMNVAFVALEYAVDTWFSRIKGLENEPERGRRCSICFQMRLDKAAEYAHQNNFHLLTSTLGISRWKDMEQVNACGHKAAQKYPGLVYWAFNWRKKGGSQRMHEIARENNLYKQTYCGCVYSQKSKHQKEAACCAPQKKSS